MASLSNSVNWKISAPLAKFLTLLLSMTIPIVVIGSVYIITGIVCLGDQEQKLTSLIKGEWEQLLWVETKVIPVMDSNNQVVRYAVDHINLAKETGNLNHLHLAAEYAVAMLDFSKSKYNEEGDLSVLATRISMINTQTMNQEEMYAATRSNHFIPAQFYLTPKQIGIRVAASLNK